MGHLFSAAHHSHNSDGCTCAEFCGDWVQGWRFSQAVYISTSLITSTPQTWRRLDIGLMIQTEESPLFLFYEVTYIYCFLQANMQMLIWISICQRIYRKERDRRKTCHSDWSLPGVHSSAWQDFVRAHEVMAPNGVTTPCIKKEKPKCPPTLSHLCKQGLALNPRGPGASP